MIPSYCLHTHTYRCGHAFGEDEAYLAFAKNENFKVIGFADHVFLPGVVQIGMRGDYSLLDDYVNSIRNLAKKYKDLKVFVGFEAEYSPIFESYYRELLNSKKIDYLIMGQHCYFDENKKHHWYFDLPDKFEALHKYTDDVISGIKSGLFTYIAHPDFIVKLFKEPNEELLSCLRRICEEAKVHNLPLEINLAGLYHRGDNLKYPFEGFFKIASEVGNDVVVGVDAHSPEAFISARYEFVDELAKKYHLHFVDPSLKIIRSMEE